MRCVSVLWPAGPIPQSLPKAEKEKEETSMQGVGCLSGLFFEPTCVLLGASLGWFPTERAMERVSLSLNLVPLRAILGMFNCVISLRVKGFEEILGYDCRILLRVLIN